MNEISIVIPAYNEAERIGSTLTKILAYCKKFKKSEIIVVDDCSTDTTASVVKKHKKIVYMKNKRNRGKGYSVKRGMLKAKYKYVLFSDADLSTPIKELDKFAKQVSNYDVVIASRNLPTSNIKIKQPKLRQFMGKTFPLLVKLLVIRGIEDTQCGFKLFKRKTIKPIFSRQTVEGFSFDVEVLFIARRLGYSIAEVPVTWINAEGSTVSPFKDSIKMLLALLAIRYKGLIGKY